MATAPAAGVVAFGVYEVDLRAEELRKRGVRIPLQRQPFRILVRLLERSGQLVTRDELRQELWADDTFVDFEHGLNVAVKRLREALGDSAETPAFIETLPRRGYRFIAPVSSVAAASTASRAGVRTWLPATVALVAVAVAASAIVLMRPRRVAALTDRDTILVADFVNHTGNAVYDGALRQALTIDLGQTPYFSVVSRERVVETLTQMRRAIDEPVVDAVAREACERSGARVSVNGAIAAIGRQLLVTIEAVNCTSGATVAEEQATAPDIDHVLNALHETSLALRKRLGESPASLQRFNTALRQATTASLEALRAFSAAEDLREREGAEHAEPLYRKALQFDPDFAMAYARLSTAAAITGHPLAEVNALTREAVARRDRVTERERMYIDYRGCGLVADLAECGIQAAEVWRRTYPRDWEPYSQLCLAYIAPSLQPEKALPNCLEALRLSPNHSVNVENLAAAYRGLNRFDDAMRVTDEGLARGVSSTLIRGGRYAIAFAKDDRAAMAVEVHAMSGDVDEPRFMLVEADAAAFEGRFRDARAIVLEAEARDAGRAPGFSQRARISAEIFEAAAGLPAEASYTADRTGNDLMLAMLRNDAEFAERLLTEPNRPNITARMGIPSRVLLDIRRGARDAITRLPPAGPGELGLRMGYHPVYLRGLAYLAAADGLHAAAEFQRILDHRGVAPLSALYPMSYVQHARASMLAHDVASARRDYETFFELWKNADSDVPILRQARAEHAKLTR